MSYSLLSEILDGMAEAVISLGEDQRITLFNAGAEKIFGYSSEEVLGQPLEILIPVKKRSGHKEKVENFGNVPHKSKLMTDRGEIEGQKKNGEVFPAEATISTVKVDGKTIFTAVLRDVSERKEAEAQLEHEKNKIYEAMLSSTHHILNNFLNQMQLFKMTAEDTPEFDPEILSLYEMVIKDASAQIDALGSIDSIDEASIRASVAP